MRRVLLVLVGLCVVVLLGRQLRLWVASPTTRIRWRLEGMEQGFNETRLGPCLRVVAETWRDETSGTERPLLADVLRSLFFHETDPESGRFPFRVELERETLSIELDPERDGHARVDVVAAFATLENGEWTPTWRVRVTADLIDDDERGWQAVRSEHETLVSDGRLLRGG
jgi:hypothetical protein